MKGIIGALLGAIVGVCAGVVIANLQGWVYSDYYSRNLMTMVAEDVRAWTSTISLAVTGGIVGGVVGRWRRLQTENSLNAQNWGFRQENTQNRPVSGFLASPSVLHTRKRSKLLSFTPQRNDLPRLHKGVSWESAEHLQYATVRASKTDQEGAIPQTHHPGQAFGKRSAERD